MIASPQPVTPSTARLRRFRLLRRLLLTCLLGILPIRADWSGLIVPAYFGPNRTTDWERLATAAAQAPVIAIANVANGPGSSPQAGYRTVLARVRDQGGRVVGYVHTRYTQRPATEVLQDMDRWADFYAVDGIFVDEMTNDGSQASLAYFGSLLAHVRARYPQWQIIGNPGTSTRESYLTAPTADVLVTFEHHTGYPTLIPDAWTRRHPSTAFAHLCYGVPSPDSMAQYLALARSRRATWIYVTDDVLPNPWDRLPTYWEDQVARVRQANADEPIRLSVTLAQPDATALSVRIESIPGGHRLEGSTDLIHWQALYQAGTLTGRIDTTLTTAGTRARFFRASR